MKPRWSWYLVIPGVIMILVAACSIIYMIVYTPPLWGIRGPLIAVMLLSSASGIGFMLVLAGIISGLISTKSRIKKQIEKRKAIKLVKKLRAM